jgi:hypothetical protein
MLALKRVTLDVRHIWLVLGGVALPIYDGLQPPWHGLYQVLELLDVVHPQDPDLVISLRKSYRLMALEILS